RAVAERRPDHAQQCRPLIPHHHPGRTTWNAAWHGVEDDAEGRRGRTAARECDGLRLAAAEPESVVEQPVANHVTEHIADNSAVPVVSPGRGGGAHRTGHGQEQLGLWPALAAASQSGDPRAQVAYQKEGGLPPAATVHESPGEPALAGAADA